MNKNKIIDKVFLIIVSAQTLLMSILFIVQVLRIYFGNNKTFTREICGEYLLQILPVIILWFVIIIVNYIYFYNKKNPNKEVAKMTYASKLYNFELMCPDYKEELNEEYSLLEKQKKNRKIAWIINIAILVVCSIMGLLYLLNVNHFKADGDLMEQAIKMSIHLLPWVIISFISLIVCTIYEEYSSKLSIEIIKEIMKINGRKPLIATLKNNSLKVNIARISILVIAVVFIITGIFNGGASDVLQKAINICTECIGLG